MPPTSHPRQRRTAQRASSSPPKARKLLSRGSCSQPRAFHSAPSVRRSWRRTCVVHTTTRARIGTLSDTGHVTVLALCPRGTRRMDAAAPIAWLSAHAARSCAIRAWRSARPRQAFCSASSAARASVAARGRDVVYVKMAERGPGSGSGAQERRGLETGLRV